MALAKELQQFVDEATGKAHPGESVRLQIHHTIREAFDVVEVLLSAGANVDELSNEAVTALQMVIGKLNLGTIGKRIAAASLPLVVPAVVEQMAAYSGTAQEFVTAKILPPLDEVIDTLVDVRGDLAGV